MNIPISEGFHWSFSKLSAFEVCPHSFLLQYLQNPSLPQQQNAWAEYGTLCHSLLEEYAKGVLPLSALPAEYQSRYPDAVVHSFPPIPKGYAEKAYRQGLRYFESFQGFGDSFKIISTEEWFKINIGAYHFVGVSDLILQNKSNGEFIVVDHKTKSESSMKNELPLYTKQLYLYAEHVKQKYGFYPAEIRFNMIKSNQPIIEKFSTEKHLETLQWAEDTIDLIFFENDWAAKPNWYYCKYICPVSQYCKEGKSLCAFRKES